MKTADTMKELVVALAGQNVTINKALVLAAIQLHGELVIGTDKSNGCFVAVPLAKIESLSWKEGPAQPR